MGSHRRRADPGAGGASSRRKTWQDLQNRMARGGSGERVYCVQTVSSVGFAARWRGAGVWEWRPRGGTVESWFRCEMDGSRQGEYRGRIRSIELIARMTVYNLGDTSCGTIGIKTPPSSRTRGRGIPRSLLRPRQKMVKKKRKAKGRFGRQCKNGGTRGRISVKSFLIRSPTEE